MRVLISSDPFRSFNPPVHPKYKREAEYWRNQVDRYAGCWLHVDTEYLYPREVAVIDENDVEIRIPMLLVVEIENDKRPNAAQCDCCKRWFLDVPEVATEKLGMCPNCRKGQLQRMKRLIEGAMGLPITRPSNAPV